jgi:hypothetical protein
MKKNTWMIIGAAAVGYLLWQSWKAGAQPENNNGTYGAGVDGGAYTIPLPSGQPQGVQDEAMRNYTNAVQTFNTAPSIQAGLDVINTGYPIGQLQRTSKTIADNVSVTGGLNSSFPGQTMTGRIAQLAGSQTPVFVSVQPAPRDQQGLTALDRVIKYGHA